eukprot:2653422-Rhodomonas_salina.1
MRCTQKPLTERSAQVHAALVAIGPPCAPVPGAPAARRTPSPSAPSPCAGRTASAAARHVRAVPRPRPGPPRPPPLRGPCPA